VSEGLQVCLQRVFGTGLCIETHHSCRIWQQYWGCKEGWEWEIMRTINHVQTSIALRAISSSSFFHNVVYHLFSCCVTLFPHRETETREIKGRISRGASTPAQVLPSEISGTISSGILKNQNKLSSQWTNEACYRISYHAWPAPCWALLPGSWGGWPIEMPLNWVDNLRASLIMEVRGTRQQSDW